MTIVMLMRSKFDYHIKNKITLKTALITRVPDTESKKDSYINIANNFQLITKARCFSIFYTAVVEFGSTSMISFLLPALIGLLILSFFWYNNINTSCKQ